MKKKRKINYFRLMLVILVPVFIIGAIILLIANRPTSIHKDANKYKNGSCVIFYPNNDQVKEYAINYCGDKKDAIVDYEVSDFGDYIKVLYNDGASFILDHSYVEPTFEIVDKKILSEELRYEYKKSEKDEAYTSKFAEDSYYTNFDVGTIYTDVYEDKVTFKFDKYDFSFDMSLGLAQKVLGANFGVNDEEYVRHFYVSEKRPVIALTYDDGPYGVVDTRLFEMFDKYDSRCTFFSVGNRFSQKELDNAKLGLSLGNEYGSHSWDHAYLNRVSAQSAYDEIMSVAKLFKDEFNYDMKVFRYPGGNKNEGMENLINLTGVLWSVDTLDWKYREANSTYDAIMTSRNGSIVLMHSLYPSSADASERAIPELIDKGYQLVTVSERLAHAN